MPRSAAILGLALLTIPVWSVLGDARADDTATPAPVPHLRCQLFLVEAASGTSVQTDDQTSEIGQWVASQAGWQVHDVDFEVGQKGTGYPQGYVNVCLSPAA